MNNKIMNRENLEDILRRLNGCASLIFMLCEVVEHSTISDDALRGVGDLLESICKDFLAELKSAEDFGGKAVQP